MSLSAEEKLLIKRRLLEAEEAEHEILTGTKSVRVQHESGDAVTFNTANLSRLRAYIASLKAKLNCQSPAQNFNIRPSFR